MENERWKNFHTSHAFGKDPFSVVMQRSLKKEHRHSCIVQQGSAQWQKRSTELCKAIARLLYPLIKDSNPHLCNSKKAIMFKVIAMIPARYAATRFPAKLMAQLIKTRYPSHTIIRLLPDF